MKKIFAVIIALMIALAALPVYAVDAEDAASLNIDDYFSKRDLAGTWSDAVTLDLSGDVTITQAGTYLLTGSAAATVTVNAGDEDKVQLVLQNVTLTPASGAAILVENADKVFITLAEGSVNTLTCNAFDESADIDGAIFSRDDIVLNGTGTLIITSAAHGIVGKDDVKIASGTCQITAEGRGITGNDSVRIADGDITIVSGKDGIRAKNEEDETKGYVVIFGGTLNITAGGGSGNAAAHTGAMMGMGRGGWSSWNTRTAADTESASTKGIKSTGSLTVAGGSITLNTADDALHSNTDLTVLGGALTIAAGDDGMHADEDLLIAGGKVVISQSYEGVEATTITISGSDVTVYASDDGLNAAGGSDSSGYGWNDMFASQEGVEIRISGGSLYVNASGDGIDSNGDLTVTGGAIVVSGPTNSGNGALDKNGAAAITGGTIIAAGATGMAESFDSTSTQGFALVSLNGQAGEIVVKDASGNTILTGTVEKSFQCVVISSPDLVSGQTYTVSCGSASATFTAGTAASGGWGNGFGGGQMPQGGGQMPQQGGQMPQQGGQMPQQGGQMPQQGGGRQGGPGGRWR